MADIFIGRNKGQVFKDVVANTSTGSTDVELRISTTNLPTIVEVERAVKDFLRYLKERAITGKSGATAAIFKDVSH